MDTICRGKNAEAQSVKVWYDTSMRDYRKRAVPGIGCGWSYFILREVDRMEEKHAGGRPRKFESPEELSKLFDEYIDHCHDVGRFSNVAGFCRYAEIDTDTYYLYKTRPEFIGAIKRCETILEDECMTSKENPVWKIFYSKNKFGYKDRTEVNQQISGTLEVSDDDKALLARLADRVKDDKDNV